jgi:acetyl/propionyl-CoA carboxylase alpha subunit
MTVVPIKKILIANRGEIARRILRTCRAMGIASVAVCSESDRDAPFVAQADEVVPLGGLTPAESYLRIDAILEAARKTGADAIHPGYGFLSENADFALACQQACITFIGPTPEAIATMGSKIEAKRRMQQADVPLLPTLEVGNQSASALLRQVETLGWPVLIKASAGGGGRGMRIVRGADEFAALLDTAKQESLAAFGDGTLFIEPYVETARHIEVQILGDTQGNVVHLFERECSIQRRHQKIIEEAPSAALDDELRRAMTGAAVRAAAAIGYVNAGTVEFLLTPDGKFYFLEVNTRLQVEHPVTECVTGLDLVRLQILIASGQPLPGEARQADINGHAIEARLYAEDPLQGYLPSAGTIHRFRFPHEPGLRIESAIDERAEVSPYFDPMLAKIIVHAPTRSEAARRLSAVLRRAQLHGLPTNRDLLVRTLEHPEFLAGRIDTHFLERHDVAILAAPLADARAERLHAAAAALAAQAQRRHTAKVLAAAPSGWRNNPAGFQQARFRGSAGEIAVEYRFSRGGLQLRVDGEELPGAKLDVAEGEQVRLEVAGVQRTFNVHCHEHTYYVDSPLGSSMLVEVPRFPLPEEQVAAGSLVAPLPGVVHEVRVACGDSVAAGDVVLVIESMKVHHWISAPLAGRIAEIRVEAGSHVQGGAVLAVIEESS